MDYSSLTTSSNFLPSLAADALLRPVVKRGLDCSGRTISEEAQARKRAFQEAMRSRYQREAAFAAMVYQRQARLHVPFRSALKPLPPAKQKTVTNL
jgi:hypothetical protein